MANSNSGADLLKSFKIPKYVIVAESKRDEQINEVPECPVLVFINSKSGGQLGGHLLVTYGQLLNAWQVRIFSYDQMFPLRVDYHFRAHFVGF